MAKKREVKTRTDEIEDELQDLYFEGMHGLVGKDKRKLKAQIKKLQKQLY